LGQTAVLDVTTGIGTGGQGVIGDTTHPIFLGAGLNVIDIDTDGNDFDLNKSNLIINGPPGSFAIFRVPDDVNFKISNGNIVVGMGMGLNNVIFYSDREDSAQHFNFNNAILNGVAFWTLAETGGEINISNAQGCTQLIADKINLNNVRFTRCAPDKMETGVPPEVFPLAVGGEFIPLDSTMILVSGAQYTAAWMIPVIVSGIGIAIVIARKF